MSVNSVLHSLVTDTEPATDESITFRCTRCHRRIGTIAPDRNTLFMGSLYVRDKTVVYCSSCNTRHKWFPQSFFDKQKAQNTLTDSSVV